MSWYGFPQLGVWSKPGGVPFLCIEPWHGFASPVDFDGEFTDKPGLMHIVPSGYPKRQLSDTRRLTDLDRTLPNESRLLQATGFPIPPPILSWLPWWAE